MLSDYLQQHEHIHMSVCVCAFIFQILLVDFLSLQWFASMNSLFCSSFYIFAMNIYFITDSCVVVVMLCYCTRCISIYIYIHKYIYCMHKQFHVFHVCVYLFKTGSGAATIHIDMMRYGVTLLPTGIQGTHGGNSATSCLDNICCCLPKQRKDALMLHLLLSFLRAVQLFSADNINKISF